MSRHRLDNAHEKSRMNDLVSALLEQSAPVGNSGRHTLESRSGLAFVRYAPAYGVFIRVTRRDEALEWDTRQIITK